MNIKRTQKHFSLHGKLKCSGMLIGLSLIAVNPSAFAADPGPYIPNLLISRQVNEGDVFGEAMSKGQAEGILIGETAKQMQLQLRVTTPVRMKVVKGGIDAAGCQIMYTSMFVTGIQAPNISPNSVDYVFTNKLTLCKENSSPLVDVTQCEFGGKSCMPPSGTKVQ